MHDDKRSSLKTQKQQNNKLEMYTKYKNSVTKFGLITWKL